MSPIAETIHDLRASRFVFSLKKVRPLLWLAVITLSELHAIAVGQSAPEEPSETSASPADTTGSAGLLTPLVITAPAYRLKLSPLDRFGLQMYFDLKASYGWPPIPDAVYTPERTAERARNSMAAVEVSDLGTFSTRTIWPHGYPVVGASPWTLRPGPNGTTRDWSAFLDGVALNDSFDGQIDWTSLPEAALARMERVPTGGASAWSEASTGIVQLFRRPVMGVLVVEPPPPNSDPDYPPPPRQVVHSTGLLEGTYGAFDTRTVEIVHTQPTLLGMVQLLGSIDRTEGFFSAVPRRAGDTKRWKRSHSFEARLRRPLSKDVEATAAVQSSELLCGLGTRSSREKERVLSASITLAGRVSGTVAWNGGVYFEDRNRAHRVAALDVSGASEIPLLDEYARPVKTWRAYYLARFLHNSSDAHTNVGVDTQWTHGEANVRADYRDGKFTHELVVAADRTKTGVFVIHNRRIVPGLRGLWGVRVDRWSDTNARLRETNLATGVSEQHETVPTHDAYEISPSAGLAWEPNESWRVLVNAQRSFRAPTLAERLAVAGDTDRVIEPNATVKSCHSTTEEIVVRYSPRSEMKLSARIFWTRLRDAIGTSSVSAVSEEGASVSVPPGVDWRLRRNFDCVQVRGCEVSAEYRKAKSVSLVAALQLQDSHIRDASAGSSLNTHAWPEVARYSAKAEAVWALTSKTDWRIGLRGFGHEFVDEENTRRLGAAVVMESTLMYRLTERVRLLVQAENVGDARVQVYRGVDGRLQRASPRQLSVGARIEW